MDGVADVSVNETSATLLSASSVPAISLSTLQRSAANALLKADEPPKMPWEMPYEERRRVSKDPRIMKQVAEEDQWLRTACSGIWKRVRQFALPRNDWLMTKNIFTDFLAANNLKSPQLQAKLFHLFETESRPGHVNGLHLTKYLHIALTTPTTLERFAKHCFECFDRPIGCNDIPVEALLKCQLLTPQEVAERSSKGKGKKRGASPKRDASPDRTKQEKAESMFAGARYESVEGLKALLHRHSVSESFVNFPLFLSYFEDGENNGEWIGSFLLQLLECCAKYFQAADGEVRLPLIPLRWLKSVEPIPISTEMYDADVVVLREIEATGIDPTKPKEKKSKKKKKSKK